MAKGPESKITFKVFNQEFNKAMDEMKNESSKLRQEFTLQQEQLKLSGTATEHLNTKLGYLQQQQQLAAQKVAATEQQLSKAKAMYGENSTEVEKLSRQLGNAQIAEQKFSNQMKETETALQRLAQQNSSTAQALTTLGAEETKLVNQSTKLRAEYDLQRASLGNHATESEKLGAKLQYLSQVQQNASQQTRNCAQQLAAAKSQYGENSSEVNKLETKLLQLSTAEQQLKNQIETTNRSLKEQEIETKRVADATRQLDTFFEATGTSVDQFANALGGHLTSAIKQGTASSSQLDEALKRIGHEALGAETDIEKLQRVLRSVDAGNSIQQVRNELRDLQQEAGRTEKKFEGLKVGLENVIGGLAAGGSIATAIEKSMDMSKLKTKIDVSFEVPESSKRSVEDAVRSVTTYGVDVEEALEGTRRQWALNKDASDEANAAIVKGAATIASTYAGIDFNELIQEANEIGATLGITNEEALGLVNTLLKTGFPPEQLDIIAEYGDQMIQAGFSAKEVQGILSAGIDTKSWNIDNLLDGVKEGRIKMAEFGAGVDKSMKEVLDKTKISADQFEKWGQAIAGGGENGQKAMLEATKALAGVENATDRNVLGTKMFGTMWEDQGKKIIDTILKAEGKQVDLKKGVDDLHNTNSKLDASPTVKMQKAINDLQKALEPVLLVIADLISKFAEWVSDNPKLAATLVAIGVAIGVISGAILAITPLIPIITSIISVIMSVAGAIAATVGVATALIPIIIAAVVALGIIIYKNWDDIQKWTIEAWNAITDFLEELWNGIMASLSETWNSIVETTTETWNSIVEYLTGIWNGVVETLSEIWSRISQTTSEVWTAIREFFISTWNGLVEFLTPILQGIADFFSMIWNGISTVIQTVWNFIMQYLQAIWTAILYFATPIFESIKNFISECWNTICSTTSFVWETIKNFLVSCWNGLVAFVMPIFEQIKSWIIAVWDTISSATITVWDTMKNFLQSCWNGLVAIGTPIFDAIKNWIVNTWNMISSTTSAVWNTIKNSLSSLWNTIVSTASSVFNTIKEAISSVWNTISSTSSTIWNGIKSTLSNIWNSITSTASSVWNGLKSAIMTPVNWVVDAVSGAFNGMKSAVLGVWDGIKSGTKTAINGVIRLINKFIDGFNTPAELLNGIPGVSAPTIPHVPMLAKGGHVLGDGQFIAGEAGPELFSKKGNKVSVTPLSSSERMGGIGGQLGLLTKSVTDMIQHAASQLAQIVAYDVPHALGEALLTSVPHIVGANAGDGILNQQPIEVNFYNTVRNDRDIDRMFEKADDWFAQKGRNLNIGIGRN
ncbi:hypothetical protein COK81_08135 [Bacillus thuringiensis]|uniref:DUF2207 domain-containing protein n=1 Tax=Bacillus thuringiensis TaxID=1428 RepID=A0A9X7B1V4_BACTU|nr:hypothetical protein [Bacillus thuringiensis]PFT96549.1 hypothetical protein COK81_08135 [Bacillus thuringiensis]